MMRNLIMRSFSRDGQLARLPRPPETAHYRRERALIFNTNEWRRYNGAKLILNENET